MQIDTHLLIKWGAIAKKEIQKRGLYISRKMMFLSFITKYWKEPLKYSSPISMGGNLLNQNLKWM